ncbi:hypothetical protein CCACVL1_24031 [Corchorus capsularis]|uniref:Uncharacterized protein n=1 Tax=Corchorus capsularis TaxID=210143 RepID=A0A1R3GRB6_COCAP|nr:hypothetical protein CCACVL1_24031 [Corchorus capsularis]
MTGASGKSRAGTTLISTPQRYNAAKAKPKRPFTSGLFPFTASCKVGSPNPAKKKQIPIHELARGRD